MFLGLRAELLVGMRVKRVMLLADGQITLVEVRSLN